MPYFNGMLAELQKQFSVVRNAGITEELLSVINRREKHVSRRLFIDNPFAEYEEAFAAARKNFKAGIYDLPATQSDLSGYKALAEFVKARCEESFWKEEIGKLKKLEEQKLAAADKKTETPASQTAATAKHSPPATAEKESAPSAEIAGDVALSEKLEDGKKTLRALLQETWQKLLDEEYAKWELEKIAEYRRALLEELQNALELIQQLADALEALSIEPGLLFDLSKDNISLSDIEKIKRWANYLSQDENVRRLCEMLGRMRTAAGVKRREIIMSSETIPAVHVDANSKEEIAGVCAGNDIEYALPQEKALLADEDTALLFDLKFAERRLMQFDMTGSEIYDLTEEKEKETEISEKEKTGPVIVCVDTSGSMKGAPETVAKAVSLYMAAAAMKQKRDCYLINFSTGIKTLDLSGRQSIAGLLKFLRLSFGGGTDAAPAIAHALQMMQTKNYKKADLLIVSDFMMDELPAALHPQIAAAKENGNKFHSLSIGGNFLRQALKDLFDNEWAYNPQNGGVRQLLDCADLAGGQKYL